MGLQDPLDLLHVSEIEGERPGRAQMFAFTFITGHLGKSWNFFLSCFVLNNVSGAVPERVTIYLKSNPKSYKPLPMFLFLLTRLKKARSMKNWLGKTAHGEEKQIKMEGIFYKDKQNIQLMRKLSRSFQGNAGSETANNSIYPYLHFLFFSGNYFIFALSFLLAASGRQRVTAVDIIILGSLIKNKIK